VQLRLATLEMLAWHLLATNYVQSADRVLGTDSVLPEGALEMAKTRLQAPVDNFYMTDPIMRISKTMAKCTRVRRTNNFE